MSESSGEGRERREHEHNARDDATDDGDRETPEVGLIADEDLPEDLQPTDDNPLAQDPDEDPE